MPLVIVGVLLWMRDIRRRWNPVRALLPWGYASYWSGTALLVLGLAFSVWARIYLGRNWSGTVTVKQQHELIRGGPYAYVRHPIYTGLLLAFIGTAIVRGEMAWCARGADRVRGLWRKLRLEERWMIETFGDEYRRYRERTAALIPFIF